MNKPTRLALAASVLAAGTAISATVVTPVGATSTIASDAGGSVNYLLTDNGGFGEAGLQRPVSTAVTLPTGTDLTDALATVAALSGAAHAESWTNGTGSGNPIFTFDLTGGGDTLINSIILWQYGNNGGPGSDNWGNHTDGFSLIFHTEAEGNSFNFGTESIEASGNMVGVSGETTVDNIAQYFAFGSDVSARYAALRIDSNHGASTASVADGDRYGLGEVRFAIPEPSTALLGSLGLLALFRRRR